MTRRQQKSRKSPDQFAYGLFRSLPATIAPIARFHAHPAGDHIVKSAILPSIIDHIETHPIRAYQILIIVIVMMALIIDGLDVQLLAYVAPVVIKQWHATQAAFGPALAAALVGMMLGSVIGGFLGDRYGRKGTLVGVTLLFGAATAAAAAAGGVAEMAAYRLIGGIGFGAVAPNAMALVAEWLPVRARARAVIALSIGTPFGGIIGATVVFALLARFGWEGCFLACGALAIVLALAMLAILPESPYFLASTGRSDAVRAAMHAVTGHPLTIVETPQEAPNPESGPKPSPFDPSYRRLITGTGISFFSIAFIAYAFAGWAPVFLTTKGFTLGQAMASLVVGNINSIVVALFSSLLIEWIGTRNLMLLCSGGMLLAVLAIAVLLEGQGVPTTAVRITVALVLGGVGGFTGAISAALYALLSLGYPADCRSSGIGIGMMIGRAGGILSALGGGWLLSIAGSSTVPFFTVLGVLSALVAGGAIVLDRHIPPARSSRLMS
jgi:AAHS family 4-hydroxybenzoate transporter-like MFS transporter